MWKRLTLRLMLWVALFTPSISLFAQLEDFDEIVNYVDTAEMNIISGRKYLINAVKQDHKEDIRKGLDFLILEGGGNYNYSMSFYEYYGLCMLSTSFQDALDAIQGYSVNDATTYPSNDGLGYAIYNALKAQKTQIQNQLYEHIMQDDASFVLQSLLVYYTTDAEPGSEYRQTNADFVKDNPNSSYSIFVKQNLPMPLPKGGTYFGLGVAMISPMGKYREFFDTGWGAFMSWEFMIQQFYVSVYFHGGTSYVTEPFVLEGKDDVLWFTNGDKFNYFTYGFDFGYDLIKDSRYLLAPALNVEGGYLESMLYDADEDGREGQMFNTFIYGASLVGACKIYAFKSEAFQGGYLGLKFKASVEVPAKSVFGSNISNNFGVFELGLIFGGGDL